MTGSGFYKLAAFFHLACGRVSVVLATLGLISAASANDAPPIAKLLSLKITPQGVKALEYASTPFLLIDAEKYVDGIAIKQKLPAVQHVFYSRGPGFHLAQEKAQ